MFNCTIHNAQPYNLSFPDCYTRLEIVTEYYEQTQKSGLNPLWFCFAIIGVAVLTHDSPSLAR